MTTTRTQALPQQSLLHRFATSLPVERMRLDRADELCEFFERAYADQPMADSFKEQTLITRRWRWLYEAVPAQSNCALPAWICLRKGRIVGHVGVLPAEAIVQGRKVPVCWAKDLIVAPEARSLGVGPLLVLAAMKAMQIPMLVAGMNEQSVSLFQQLGFCDGGTIPLYVKVYEPQRLADTLPWSPIRRRLTSIAIRVGQSLRKFSFLPAGRESLVVVTLDRFDERFSRWWAGLEPFFPCIVRRSAETMAWRYHGHPAHNYHILAAVEGEALRGLAVVRRGWSRGMPAGFITELLAHPEDRAAMGSLLEHAERWLTEDQESRPVFIRCAVHHPAFEQALAKAGFLRAPSPFRWMASCDENQPDLRELQRQENWFLSTGDSDLDFF